VSEANGFDFAFEFSEGAGEPTPEGYPVAYLSKTKIENYIED
jgi:hypothetical protein